MLNIVLIISDIYNAIFAWAQIHYILITIILGIILVAFYLNMKCVETYFDGICILFAMVVILFVTSCCNMFRHIYNSIEQTYINYKAVHTKPEIKTTTIVEKTPGINTNIKAVITENGISREVNINVNSYELDNNSLNIITDNVKQSIVNINNQRLNME